jgi:glycosyltransferase family protein
MLNKVKKEWERFRNKLFRSNKVYKQLDEVQFRLDNVPYEIYAKVVKGDLHLQIPSIKTVDETLDKILQNNCSLARFGDGEFAVMNSSRIHFQEPCPALAERLKTVIASDLPNLLVGLPDCFGSLDQYLPSVANFWRKWMSQKRAMVYTYLDADRIYYNAFFTRVYMPFNKTGEHCRNCGRYFEKVKKIWAGRDVIICEGEGTRFGMFNDLLKDAKSIARILCPARNAFDKYDEILSAFDGIAKDKLVLAALGPTATVLAYDLCQKGYQAIDIGHLDVEYEWFLRKDVDGRPLEYKYVDGSKAGRKVHPLENPEYKKQIIKKILTNQCIV